jgi:glycosyltransferase involved in cell wall biosynthesis
MGRKIRELRPDVVTIHWVSADTISLNEILKINVPVIIILHDLWFLLGCSAYPGKDTRHITGFTAKNSNLIERLIWRRKKKLSEQRAIYFVAPSKWAASVAKQSVVGGKQSCLAIPNPMDVALFQFDLAKVKDNRKFTILFGCNGGTKNPYKGFNDLRSALERIPAEVANRMRVVVFGESSKPCSINGVAVTYLCKITKVEYLIEVYHNADMFAFPSIEVTQGQTKIEALACGLPVVAFDRTACAEGIIHKETGWIAQDGDIAGYKDGILWWYEKCSNKAVFRKLRKKISLSAHENYSENTIIRQWLDLFRELRP